MTKQLTNIGQHGRKSQAPDGMLELIAELLALFGVGRDDFSVEVENKRRPQMAFVFKPIRQERNNRLIIDVRVNGHQPRRTRITVHNGNAEKVFSGISDYHRRGLLTVERWPQTVDGRLTNKHQEFWTDECLKNFSVLCLSNTDPIMSARGKIKHFAKVLEEHFKMQGAQVPRNMQETVQYLVYIGWIRLTQAGGSKPGVHASYWVQMGPKMQKCIGVMFGRLSPEATPYEVDRFVNGTKLVSDEFIRNRREKIRAETERNRLEKLKELTVAKLDEIRCEIGLLEEKIRQLETDSGVLPDLLAENYPGLSELIKVIVGK